MNNDNEEKASRMELLARLEDHGASLDQIAKAAHEEPDVLRRVVEAVERNPWLLHGTERTKGQ